jgi:hypothetical protein
VSVSDSENECDQQPAEKVSRREEAWLLSAAAVKESYDLDTYKIELLNDQTNVPVALAAAAVKPG